MGGSSNNQTPVTQQTQQTRDPWAPAQPHLTGAMNAAQSLYNTNTGYTPYPGDTQAGLHGWLANTQATLASQLQPEVTAGGSAGVNAGRGLGLNMIENQGLTPGLLQQAGQYQTLYDEASGQQNPYLQSMLDTSNRQISDKIGSSMSGAGRYGSGQHTDVAARAMAEAADPVLAQDYARRQAQRMQATGAEADIYSGGLQRAGQWAQLMPTLDEARWAPAQSLMALGQYQSEREQSKVNDYIKTYNAQQAYPWEQLARYNAITGGAGGLGGTMSGTTTTPINSPSTLQKILGGGLAGAGIGGSFGGAPGAGLGAIGGGLLGMM